MTQEALTPQAPRMIVEKDEGHKHINLGIHDICPHGHLLVNFLRLHLMNDRETHAQKEVWPRTIVNESFTRIAIRTRSDEECEKGKHYVEIRDYLDEDHTPFCELKVFEMSTDGAQEVAHYPKLKSAEFTQMFETIYQFLDTCKKWDEVNA